MSIMLQTIMSDEGSRSLSKEEEGRYPGSRTAIIDPRQLFHSEFGLNILQDTSVFAPEVTDLFDRMEHIAELFLQAPKLKEIAGTISEHQMVIVDPLENALQEVPNTPVIIDTMQKHPEPMGQLMSFNLAKSTSLVPFLKMGFHFYDHPKWSPFQGKIGICLRDPRIGERMSPGFIQQGRIPNGIGRIDDEAHRSNAGPLYVLLSVTSADTYQITDRAIELVDQYCTNAVEDSLTLGEDAY